MEKGNEGQYRIKLAHIYKDRQRKPNYCANADTGYCGNVVLSDGTIVTSTYGKFDPKDRIDLIGTLKTSICSKRISLKDTDVLVENMKNYS